MPCRCPLSCPYCSNPLELTRAKEELSTAEWIDVFHQAARMGVLQIHLSGGEPASRRDLEDLTEGARKAGLYTNLITSGVGLTEARFADLLDRGLDHLQLSLQGVDAETANRLGGYKRGFEQMEADWLPETRKRKYSRDRRSQVLVKKLV